MVKPKNTFNQGEDILASKMNENFEEVWENIGIYGESDGSVDTYSISANIDSLYEGLVVSFKANFTNEGRCYLNVNEIGAKEIKIKTIQEGAYGHQLQYLSAGDIQQGQIITVVYDGTDFQYVNFKKTTYNFIKTTRDVSVSGTQTIEHGLGFSPKKIKIHAFLSGVDYQESIGTAIKVDGFTWEGVPTTLFKNVCSIIGVGSPATSCIAMLGGGSNFVTVTATWDETNITLNWQKTGSPTGTAGFILEVEG